MNAVQTDFTEDVVYLEASRRKPPTGCTSFMVTELPIIIFSMGGVIGIRYKAEQDVISSARSKQVA